MILSEKITLEALKAHLWKASDILRGSLDAQEYRQPVMTVLFLKRLNDTFEENVEKLVLEGNTQKKAEQKFRHKFYVPETARWSVLANASSNLGEIIDNVCRQDIFSCHCILCLKVHLQVLELLFLYLDIHYR